MQPGRILVALGAAFTLSACAIQKAQTYQPAPLSAARDSASLETRSLTGAGLRAFLEARSQPPPAVWPPPEWTLPGLTLAAFYFNPTLAIERARVAEADAAIVTASARPNPGVSVDLGGETAVESPWIAGLGFSLPIETAHKRLYRTTEAQRLADAARWSLAGAAWKVRAAVRGALVEYIASRRSIEKLAAEERVRAGQMELLEQRLAAGLIPRPDVDAARVEHTRLLVAVRAAEGRIAQSDAALAAAIGVPAAALRDLRIVWPEFDSLPDAAHLAPGKIREDAVLNRIDIRQSLAAYSAAEAALQLEIAKQYPDLDIGPGYAFEEGVHLFSVAANLTLPVFNRNQGPIAEAEARREEMAAQFRAAQAAGIAATEEALAKYEAALSQVSQAAALIDQAETQRQAAQTALTAGEGDRLALNAAQLQSAIAMAAKLDAVYGAQQALGELEDAVQRPLLPGDIQPLSPDAAALRAQANPAPAEKAAAR
jgi:cobalt-zinc-cadmium efflux system outer membrane protein